MADVDQLAATLAGIREHNERVIALCDMAPAIVWQLAEHDVPRLLAAVEAALKKADGWDAESDRLDAVADNPGCDEDARPVSSGEAQGYSDCAADLREAITAALAGEGTDGA